MKREIDVTTLSEKVLKSATKLESLKIKFELCKTVAERMCIYGYNEFKITSIVEETYEYTIIKVIGSVVEEYEYKESDY